MSSDDDMAWTTEADELVYDSGAYDRGDLDTGGEQVNKEGWYHLEVTDVKPDLATLDNNGNPHSPQICFTMMVLQTVDGQSPAGSRLYHRIYLGTKDGGPPKDAVVKAALRLGIALGLLEYTEIEGAEVPVIAGTKNTRIPASVWRGAKGRQIVANVKLEKGTGNYKDKYAIPFGECYDPMDEAVAQVEKNIDALALLGKTPPAAPPQQPPKQPPAPPKAPFGGDDDLGDL